MNIAEAKNEIKNTLKIYLQKDESGEYVIPTERQRPVLLIGAPGIGKTAIMKEIADELGVGYLGYTITHHTRQSAMGLPFISKKKYGDKEYSVTEYTMSEIVAKVYEVMESSKQKEGILFIDEINCVSETLAPAMLELLQHKRFGAHEIPKGWILTSAGNPEEYNKSVNELDMVTLDRVKKIDVEPDYEAFKIYAVNHNMHPSITSFLSLHSGYLFKAERGASGYKFVTPRGWEDLSTALYEYEKLSIDVNLSFVSEYVQFPLVASEFYRFYSVFRSLGDYLIGDKIENGETEKVDVNSLSMEERFALSDILTQKISKLANKAMAKIDVATEANDILKRSLSSDADKISLETEALIHKAENCGDRFKKSAYRAIIAMISDKDYKKSIEDYYEESLTYAKKCSTRAENVLIFGEKSFGNGVELATIVKSIITSGDFIKLITTVGCDKFFELNERLLSQSESEELKKLAKGVLLKK